ncbi:MAG: DinB family protein, partial [Dehalococcoidia bacterium]
EPRLEPYDQEALIRERNPQDATLTALLDEFAAQRGETIDMLADLVHWNWARQGRHPEFGRMSIRQLVDDTIAHDENHLTQIRALKTSAGR